MLYIKWRDSFGREEERVWHVGSPLPRINGRVVTFQADGDELAALIEGLDSTHPNTGRRIVREALKEALDGPDQGC